ncbi:MAG: cyclic nucleotide-binding domain-containing protein [Frankiales bacterium]|nr:cyclic nucleotide-binding domain-containing protein [Frankiales bacterium]
MSATSHMLARVDLFAELPEPVREEMASRGSTRRIPGGQPIVTQGQDDAGLQMITAGTAEVLVHGNPVRTLEEGDYFGEISLIDGQPRSATIVAGADGCQTFTVSPLLFWQILDENHGVSRLVMKGLTARLRAAEAALQEARRS